MFRIGKKGLQTRLLEALRPLSPLNYGEAIKDYTPTQNAYSYRIRTGRRRVGCLT